MALCKSRLLLLVFIAFTFNLDSVAQSYQYFRTGNAADVQTKPVAQSPSAQMHPCIPTTQKPPGPLPPLPPVASPPLPVALPLPPVPSDSPESPHPMIEHATRTSPTALFEAVRVYMCDPFQRATAETLIIGLPLRRDVVSAVTAGVARSAGRCPTAVSTWLENGSRIVGAHVIP